MGKQVNEHTGKALYATFVTICFTRLTFAQILLYILVGDTITSLDAIFHTRTTHRTFVCSIIGSERNDGRACSRSFKQSHWNISNAEGDPKHYALSSSRMLQFSHLQTSQSMNT